MRIALDPRARRLLRRVPRNTVYSAMELVLLSLLALQCGRLVWTIATPVDPVGDWRAGSAVPVPPPGSGTLLGQFDPFFRLSGDTGPLTVTSLDLKLFGVREDRATGRGSAIIGTPDGQQKSYAVGEEIMPGVILSTVNFDSVTISRSGTAEQMFLDQSPPATVVSPGEDRADGSAGSVMPPPGGSPTPTPGPAGTAPASSILSSMRFLPRMEDGEVTGVTVQPQGSGDAFRAAGFAPGDVIVSVNGRQISSAEEARSIAAQLNGRSEVAVEVERDGRTVSLRVGPEQ